MREMTIDELKKIQLEILCSVASFCDLNDIRYWIDSGTLLGAVRHRGYIPWDDDIDVGMLREDYDKFSSIFNKDQNKYKFVCYENTNEFYLPHGKVCDPGTLLYEPDEKGIKFAVNIDIFVYDNAPDNNNELKKMYDRRDKLRKIYSVQHQNVFQNGTLIKGFLKLIRQWIYKIIYPKDSIKKMIENSKKYAFMTTGRVGNFTAYTRMACDKRVFDNFVELEFEGKRFKAPIGYDEWLSSFYGNYMELPPVEKRVSHHSFKAYVDDEKK